MGGFGPFQWLVGKNGESPRLPISGIGGEFAVTEHGLYLIDSDAEHGPSVMYYNTQTHRLTLGIHLEKWCATCHLRGRQNLGASRDAGKTVLFVMGTSKSSIVMAEKFQ